MLNHTGPKESLVETGNEKKKKIFRPLFYSTTKLNIAPSRNVQSNYALTNFFFYQTNVNTISSTARIVHDYSMSVTLRKMFPSVYLLWTPEGEEIWSESTCVLMNGQNTVLLCSRNIIEGNTLLLLKLFPMGIHVLYIRENTTQLVQPAGYGNNTLYSTNIKVSFLLR